MGESVYIKQKWPNLESAEGDTGGKSVSGANANADNVIVPTAVDAYRKLLASVNDITCKITMYDQKLVHLTQKLETSICIVCGSQI